MTEWKSLSREDDMCTICFSTESAPEFREIDELLLPSPPPPTPSGPESIKESRTLFGSTLPVLLSRVLPSAAGCKIQIVCTLYADPDPKHKKQKHKTKKRFSNEY